MTKLIPLSKIFNKILWFNCVENSSFLFLFFHSKENCWLGEERIDFPNVVLFVPLFLFSDILHSVFCTKNIVSMTSVTGLLSSSYCLGLAVGSTSNRSDGRRIESSEYFFPSIPLWPTMIWQRWCSLWWSQQWLGVPSFMTLSLTRPWNIIFSPSPSDLGVVTTSHCCSSLGASSSFTLTLSIPLLIIIHENVFIYLWKYDIYSLPRPWLIETVRDHWVSEGREGQQMLSVWYEEERNMKNY